MTMDNFVYLEGMMKDKCMGLGPIGTKKGKLRWSEHMRMIV